MRGVRKPHGRTRFTLRRVIVAKGRIDEAPDLGEGLLGGRRSLIRSERRLASLRGRS